MLAMLHRIPVVIVGSTDILEFGKAIVKNVLLRANAHVFDLGSIIMGGLIPFVLIVRILLNPFFL